MIPTTQISLDTFFIASQIKSVQYYPASLTKYKKVYNFLKNSGIPTSILDRLEYLPLVPKKIKQLKNMHKIKRINTSAEDFILASIAKEKEYYVASYDKHFFTELKYKLEIHAYSPDLCYADDDRAQYVIDTNLLIPFCEKKGMGKREEIIAMITGLEESKFILTSPIYFEFQRVLERIQNEQNQAQIERELIVQERRDSRKKHHRKINHNAAVNKAKDYTTPEEFGYVRKICSVGNCF